MDNKNIPLRLNAVINTLNAATLRADQLDAVQRISACTMELHSIIKELQTPSQPQDQPQDQPQKG